MPLLRLTRLYKTRSKVGRTPRVEKQREKIQDAFFFFFIQIEEWLELNWQPNNNKNPEKTGQANGNCPMSRHVPYLHFSLFFFFHVNLEECRVGRGVDIGVRRILKKKKQRATALSMI